MRVLHLANSDGGGAGRAAYRLHRGLRDSDIDSQMLVQHKTHDDRTVTVDPSTLSKLISKLKLSEHLDKLPLKRYPDRDRTDFSLQWVMDKIPSRVEQLKADVINLHWICNGFVQIESLAKFRRPLVWTLHDMWPFTGGCHYTPECDRYMESCGKCPILHSLNPVDVSQRVWKRKAQAWKSLNLTIISPSTWLADCAKSSSLLRDRRIEVIPHGLDTQIYKPIDREMARQLLNLPQDKQLVLFGALYPNSDRRKGFHLLQPALQRLSQSGWKDRIELVIFGASRPEQPVDVGFKCHYLGRLHDDTSLVTAYAAADVMIVPSLQEAFGQTASESLACGTPVVAFAATGLKDIVEHQKTGYLAQPYEIEDLAMGITWVLDNPEQYPKLRQAARAKAAVEWTFERQANRYIDVFKDILS
ncbi:glycosyltransferase family 4 protein [Roseofilum capinflatum]|uniref:Glycosyltransferase family 4 protein n=1 Tax=Roseofilum capinflatum BLCC-M114 TaxID=3022440 RepID=A0ABT7B8I7_9CYAN|nr:glycosyltransferase family 4 protein [Roseofilum capinflatum]MDJ1175488.1 glycosyltransferase family 4 protein [Roseofilum capinflatum BLCC-M114]